MNVSDAKQLRELQAENRKLRQVLVKAARKEL